MKTKLLLTLGFSVIIFGLLALTNSTSVFAATCSWTGATNGNWNTSSNWTSCGGTIPQNGDGISIPNTASNTTTTNDIVGLTVASIASDVNFVINGNDLSISGGITVTSGFLIIHPNLTLTAGQTFNNASGAALTFTGNISMGTSHNLVFTSPTAQIVVQGVISGNSNITKNGVGQLVLAGANTYGGTTTVNAGSINIQNNTALGSSSSGTTVASGATVNLDGGVLLTVAEPFTISGVGDVGGGALRNFLASTNSEISGNITFAANATIRSDVGLTLKLSGVLSGSFNPTFDGNIILTNNNTITGTALLGSAPDSFVTFNGTNVNLNVSTGGSGSTIGGSGSIKSLLATSGTAIVAPGNSPGILTIINDMTLNSSDTASFEINGANVGTEYDQIQVGGNATITDAILSLSLGYIPDGGTVYTIMHVDGTITGTFNGLSDGAIIGIGDELFAIHYGAHDITLTVGYTLQNTGFSINPTTAVVGTDLTINTSWGGNGTTPTGTVTLVVDSVPTSITATLVGGSAVLHVSNLAVGGHILTIQYEGDSNFSPAISNGLSVTITAALAATGVNVPVGIIATIGVVSGIAIFSISRKKKFLK